MAFNMYVAMKCHKRKRKSERKEGVVFALKSVMWSSFRGSSPSIPTVSHQKSDPFLCMSLFMNLPKVISFASDTTGCVRTNLPDF